MKFSATSVASRNPLIFYASYDPEVKLWNRKSRERRLGKGSLHRACERVIGESPEHANRYTRDILRTDHCFTLYTDESSRIVLKLRNTSLSPSLSYYILYTCAFNRTSNIATCLLRRNKQRDVYFYVSTAARSELYQRQVLFSLSLSLFLSISFSFYLSLSLSLCLSFSLLRKRSDYTTNACLTALAKLRYVLFNTCNAGESDPKHTVVSGGTD